MRTPRLIDRVGPDPVLHSWGYADAFLRTVARHAPLPNFPLFRKPLYPRGYPSIGDIPGLWVPLECVITRVASAAGSNSVADTLDVTITGTTAGNILIAGATAALNSGPAAIDSVSDTTNGAWTRATAASATDNGVPQLLNDYYYFLNTAAGVTKATLAAANSGTRGLCMRVWEWSGIATSSPQDGNGVATNNQNSANPTGPTITNGQAIALILTTLQCNHGPTGGTSGGFTAEVASGSLTDVTWSYQTVASIASYGTSWTATSGHWCSNIISFKGAGAGATVTYPELERAIRGFNRGLCTGMN